MTSEERIWKAVKLEEPDRVPCCIDVGFQTAKVAGISIRELMFEPITAWEAGKRVFELYGGGFDAWSDYSTTGAEYLAPIPNSHSSVFFNWRRASISFISPRQFEEVVWPFFRKEAEEFMKQGYTVLFHLDNDYTKVLHLFKEFPRKRSIFHFDLTDMFKAKEVLGDHSCIMGNVPPSLLTLGTPKQVDDYCHRLIETCGEGGGFILAQACTVPYNATFENVKAMKEAITRYNPYL
jgi:uroporphyrinogen-III decarboxylase